MAITRVTIYGERCSGTNYLERVITMNFKAQITWDYGWKHFFGYSDLKKCDNVLFICIVRDLCDWIKSFYREQWHLPLKYDKTLTKEQRIDRFLNAEFWSFDDNRGNKDTRAEIMKDRNIYTGERYKNIFELRHTKINFLLEDLPTLVKNVVFIRYEDLVNDFITTMTKIRDAGLVVKSQANFPVNSTKYGMSGSDYKTVKRRKINHISRDMILSNPNLIRYYEEKLGYIEPVTLESETSASPTPTEEDLPMSVEPIRPLISAEEDSEPPITLKPISEPVRHQVGSKTRTIRVPVGRLDTIHTSRGSSLAIRKPPPYTKWRRR